MKFFGKVGFRVGEEEVTLGVWKPVIVERQYTGDVTRNIRRYDYGSNTQSLDLIASNQISLLSDLYARQNWSSICYVIWNGVKWIVSSVEVNYPRLLLTLGERYDENETGAS